MNDSLGADDEATNKVEDGWMEAVPPSVAGVMVLVGEGDLSAVLILAVLTF